MAQQEEGWPLGLQPLNVRVVGLAARNNGDYSGSVSFNTLVTGSPISSTDSSSDLDTESTGSFFYDRSITLGSLIGVSSIFELSKRSLRRRKIQPSASAEESKPKNKSSRSWLLFSFCSSENSIATNENYKRNKNYPSLGHFLAVERKAANDQAGGGRNQLMSPNNVFVADYELSVTQPNTEIERNTLFVNGCIAPPRSSSCSGSDMESRNKDGMGNDGRFGVPEFFSCMCGKPSH